MKKLSIQTDDATLTTAITFLERPLPDEVRALLSARNMIMFRRNLLFAWIADGFAAVGWGDSAPGRIARLSVEIKDTDYRYGGLLLTAFAAIIISLIVGGIGALTGHGFVPSLLVSLRNAALLYLFAVGFSYLLMLIMRPGDGVMDAPRALEISAVDGTVRITSAYDRLRREACGSTYRPKTLRLSEIAGIEEQSVAQLRGSSSHAAINSFEVSAFMASGARHVLMHDGCGPDNARQFRTRLARLIHTARAASANRERLIAANAMTPAAHDALAATFKIAPENPATLQHGAAGFALNVAPPDDRL